MMGYYMGDFYSGRRSGRGDPGFFSFLGGLAKTVGGFIPGVGPMISAAGEKLAQIGAKQAPGKLLTMGKAAGSAIIKHPGITAAGTAAVAAAGGALAGHMLTKRGGAGGRKR